MPDMRPVKLVEDTETGNRLLLYSDSRGVQLELQYEGEALWMTQAQIAMLYGRDVSVISRHIANILEENELDETHLQKMQMSGTERVLALYSLDMIISIGYRVSSKQATLFRKWATDKLVQFATKGFVIDSQRLKQPDSRDRIAELKEIIRDIRSDEANVYREMKRICSLCQDYDPKSEQWIDFYSHTQAKLLYSVVSRTPSELIAERADADAENMGLQIWPNEHIRKADVIVAKNYLQEPEIRELNRLTTILLDIFEDQLDIGRMKTMLQAAQLLDKQLADLGRSVLSHGGKISREQANKYAEGAYESFKVRLKSIRNLEADKSIADIRRSLKKLPKS